jgi:dihydrofolate synthase / folylpolyglutamate synthase
MSEQLEWLYARQNVGIKLGLQNITALLDRLGNPQEKFLSIHIAGTNGKGSVAHMLSASLQRAGHQVGTFTSPHLISFGERVRINGQDIPAIVVDNILDELRSHVAALDELDQRATFFEITTALAFIHFARSGVEYAVLETGLGGRLDATNIVTPVLTIITSIGLDHQAMLGNTIAEIASEKAGIMKPGVPCVTSARDEALIVLKARSQELEIPMSIVGADYHALPTVNGFRLAHPGGDAEYNLPLAGAHQIENAALVVAAADALRLSGISLPDSAVQHALAETNIPGRLESFTYRRDERQIEVLIDGAHNEAGAQALRYHLGRINWEGFAWIVGFSADKEWTSMLDQCMPLAARVYGVRLRTARSLAPVELGARVHAAGFQFSEAPTVEDALALAAADGHKRILIAGSMFLVGEARAVLTGQSMEDIRGDQ